MGSETINKILKEIEEISPNKFTWDKCGIHNQYTIDDVLINGILKNDVEIIGYTSKNEIRPSNNTEVVVMFLIKGEEIWLHIGIEQLETLAKEKGVENGK